MNLLSSITSLLGLRSKERGVRGARFLRAKYDAAAHTDELRRWWANADGLSADEANSPEVRRILRNRARYEFANNCYASGIARTVANYVVGTGPRLQLLGEYAPGVTALVEREFARWARRIGLAEKLRTLKMVGIVDGEAFAVLSSNARIAHPVKLDLRLVEADRITAPLGIPRDVRHVDGVVLDEQDNPKSYYILKEHPGGPRSLVRAADYDEIDAQDVLHWYRGDRPGQHRGVSELAPALALFALLRRYTLAVLGAAEVAADLAAVIYSDALPEDDGQSGSQPEPFDTVEIERRLMPFLPGGWKLEQLRAEQPTTTYAEFKKEILAEIARCLLVPYNVAAGNSGGLNYASGRLDHQTFFAANAIEQDRLETMVVDRIFEAWIAEAVLIDGYLPQALRSMNADLSHEWFWDGPEHVDPAKEASAFETLYRSHGQTLARHFARKGLDWETETRQMARERTLLRELGLLDSVVPVATPVRPEDEDEDDEEAEE